MSDNTTSDDKPVLVGFEAAVDQVRAERDRIEKKYGYVTSGDAKKSAGDFAVYLMTYQYHLNKQISSHSPADVKAADETFAKIAGLALSYLASRVDEKQTARERYGIPSGVAIKQFIDALAAKPTDKVTFRRNAMKAESARLELEGEKKAVLDASPYKGKGSFLAQFENAQVDTWPVYLKYWKSIDSTGRLWEWIRDALLTLMLHERISKESFKELYLPFEGILSPSDLRFE